MSSLKNDRGFTPSNPYSWGFASKADLESWGRLHVEQRAAVIGLLAGEGATMPGASEVQAWVDGSERFDALADVGMGFEILWDFGDGLMPPSNAMVTDQAVASALTSEQYLAQLRAYAGSEIPGGATAGAENEGTPNEGASSSGTTARAWIWGGALGAIAALWLSRDR